MRIADAPGDLSNPQSPVRDRLRRQFGFAQTGDALAFLPLASFLKDFNTLEPLEHIAFAAKGGCRAQTAML